MATNNLSIRDDRGQIVAVNRQFVSQETINLLDAMSAWTPVKVKAFWNSILGKQLFAMICNECFYQAFLQKLMNEWMHREALLESATRGVKSESSRSIDDKPIIKRATLDMEMQKKAEEQLKTLVKNLTKTIEKYQNIVGKLIQNGQNKLANAGIRLPELSAMNEPFVLMPKGILPEKSPYLRTMGTRWQEHYTDKAKDDKVVLNEPLPEMTKEDEQYLLDKKKGLSQEIAVMDSYQQEIQQEIDSLSMTFEKYKALYLKIPSIYDRRFSTNRNEEILKLLGQLNSPYQSLAIEFKRLQYRRFQSEVHLDLIDYCKTGTFRMSRDVVFMSSLYMNTVMGQSVQNASVYEKNYHLFAKQQTPDFLSINHSNGIMHSRKT